MPSPRDWDFDGIYYVKRKPTCVREEGMFHVRHAIGKWRFEFVFRPSLFLSTLRDFNREADAFHENGSAPVPMRRSRKKAEEGH